MCHAVASIKCSVSLFLLDAQPSLLHCATALSSKPCGTRTQGANASTPEGTPLVTVAPRAAHRLPLCCGCVCLCSCMHRFTAGARQPCGKAKHKHYRSTRGVRAATLRFDPWCCILCAASCCCCCCLPSVARPRTTGGGPSLLLRDCVQYACDLHDHFGATPPFCSLPHEGDAWDGL